MRPSFLVTALAALAALALAAQPGTAAAQPTRARVAAGPAFVGGAFPDAGFQLAYSFHATGFAPGSAGAGAIAGGVGACHATDACAATAARDWVAGGTGFFVGLDFGGPFFGSPSLYVNDLVGGSPGATLSLDPFVPAAPLNAFYVVLTPPVGGTMTLGNATFFGAPPASVDGFATSGGGSSYALYRYDDLRDGSLILDLDLTGNGAGAGAPSVTVYVGSLPVTATPEPATLALVAGGLLATLALARRRTLGLVRAAR